MPAEPTPFEVKTGSGGLDVTTKRLTARIALPSGAVSFLDREGRVLLAEKAGGGRSLVPARVMEEETFHVQAAVRAGCRARRSTASGRTRTAS